MTRWIQRDVRRRQKSFASEEIEGGTSGLRALLVMTVMGFTSFAGSAQFYWDGKTYIPVGLQARSETVIRLPEPIRAFWPEEDEAINFNKIDERTLSVSPRAPSVEQRVFVLGESGNIYLANASTRLKYAPIIEVKDVSARHPGPADGPLPTVTVATLMFNMMRRERPPGFSVAPSTREILRGEEYRIDATEVWSSPWMTGVFATISRTSPSGVTVEIDPAQVEVYIADLGPLRIIGADRFRLDDAAPSTTAYLVFAKH